MANSLLQALKTFQYWQRIKKPIRQVLVLVNYFHLELSSQFVPASVCPTVAADVVETPEK